MSRARTFRLRRRVQSSRTLPGRNRNRRSLSTGSRGVWKERRLGVVV